MAGIFGPNAYATSEEPVRFVGESFVCPAGSSSHDITPPRPVRLKGGRFWVDTPVLGDRVTLQVIGPDGSVVSTYCDRLPVAPFPVVEIVESPTTGLIPSGFKVRVVYERTGGTDCTIGVSLMWLETE